MKSRNEDRRGDRGWRDEPGQGQRQHEAFQGRGAQMGGSTYGGREAPWGGRDDDRYRSEERSAYYNDNNDNNYNDESRGRMGGGGQHEDRAYQGRDSWRTHGQGQGQGHFYGPGMYGPGGESGRGTLGAGYMSDYGDQREDWNRSGGQRAWSGIGRGMQERGMDQGRHSDPDYLQWRNEQLRRFDDDFEAFRRERYGKFASEFDTWRSNRSNQGGSNEGKSAGAQAGTPAASGTASEMVGGRSGDSSSSKQNS